MPAMNVRMRKSGPFSGIYNTQINLIKMFETYRPCQLRASIQALEVLKLAYDSEIVYLKRGPIEYHMTIRQASFYSPVLCSYTEVQDARGAD